MGKVNAVLYRFDDCQCSNVLGRLESIPAGVYPVAELNVITVHIGAAILDLNKSAFDLLKAQGKVRKIG